ncbi:MAG: hypothetical protein V1729_04985 [Candidatus Woesearchaeota archaeon]
MEMKFPCGSKGSPDFCPNLCQYGKFCNVKDKKKEVPRGFQETPVHKEKSDADSAQEQSKVEFYY